MRADGLSSGRARLTHAVFVTTALVCVTAASPARAVTGCKATIDAGGEVEVSAGDVGTDLRWGTTSETIGFIFANPDCVVSGAARKCRLGAPGTLAARTAPATCNVYLRSSTGPCTALVKHCSPGIRLIDDSFLESDPRRLNAIPADSIVTIVETSEDADYNQVRRPTVRFTGVNVQVVNGSGDTYASNGLGNLVLGYNAARDVEVNESGARPGSHNLVIGDGHEYHSSGGLVAGLSNFLAADGASIAGGYYHQASGVYSFIGGGVGGCTQGEASAMVGGEGNSVTGQFAAVLGGQANIADGADSSVSGGRSNMATGAFSAVGGGKNRTASGSDNWVAGTLLQTD